MRFTIEELIEATGANIIVASDGEDDFEISTDTRTIGSGMLILYKTHSMQGLRGVLLRT